MRRRRITRAACRATVFALFAAAASATAAPQPEPTPMPFLETQRAPQPIHIDGLLDDEAWASVVPYTDFTQRDPEEGTPATERTELRVLYDEDALIVGVRLFDSEPGAIVRRLAPRDKSSAADSFSIFLDPRRDRLTGVRFEVSAAGVQNDEIIYNDTDMDDSWDAVWLSAVHHDEMGWSLEMRIPFSELRFLPGDCQTWGINASRHIKRKNETVWLSLVPKAESGFASRMGELRGLRDLRSRAPLIIVPYATGSVEVAPSDSGDPFFDGRRGLGRAGVDLRRKLGVAFALDATVNPDFGQVEVDPAVVNLTDFETFLPEKRPFFVEGSQIFDSFGRGGANNSYGFLRSEPTLFYTRRIGRAPHGTPEGDHVSSSTTTTILGAAKLTGKTASGWSVGLLEALTGREDARYLSDGTFGRQETEPLSNYLVARANRDGRRVGYGLLFTAVNRHLGEQTLAPILPTEAYVGGVDAYVFVDPKRDWVVSGRLARSHVAGHRLAIRELQHSSTRYFQRPDQTNVHVDPTRESLAGWTGNLNLNRQSGSARLNVAMWATSPGFESNDLGFNAHSDRWGGHVVAEIRKSEPDGFTRYRALTVAKSWAANFGGEKQGDAVNVSGRLLFRNYWSTGGYGSYRARAFDDRQTRGGPSMATGRFWSGGLWLRTDERKPFVARLDSYASGNEWGSRQWDGEASVEVRPSSALTFSIGSSVSKAERVAQWVTSVEDLGLASNLGGHYVFSGFEQTELALTARVNWILSPHLSLQLFARPLVSRGSYAGFVELARARSFDFTRYTSDAVTYDEATRTYTVSPGSGTSGSFSFENPDFSYRSLRLNTVLRWEWRPGSTLYAVWTQGRESTSDPGSSDLGRDLDALFGSPSTNIVAVKVSFRIGG